MKSTVFGYLRCYQRWNGDPGFSLEQQRAWISEVSRERGYGRCGRFFRTEQIDAEANGWPQLRNVVRIAEDNEGRDLLVVVPTLDGVQYNLSFLALLVGMNFPVYVRSGWRQPTHRGSWDLDCPRRERALGWLLTLDSDANEFAKIVRAVAARNFKLRESIRLGLARASIEGAKLGAARKNSYRFTNADQRTGGQASAKRRRSAANDPYKTWLPQIQQWHRNGESLGAIAMRLDDKGLRTPAGGTITRMLIHRIFKRATTDGAVESPL